MSYSPVPRETPSGGVSRGTFSCAGRHTPTVPKVFSYTVFSNNPIICSGVALVVTSQSLVFIPIKRSLTQPPTKYASNPAFSKVLVTCETSLGIFSIKFMIFFIEFLCTRQDSNLQ